MKLKVYSLLSVSAEQVASILPDAEVVAPIARGDLGRDIAEGVGVVAIIDGVFYQALAVSPAEIIDALRAGLRVHGSSSMGALRAAELESYGMVGHGRIFERIRDAGSFRDDYLAQTFDEDHRARAPAYVDLSMTMERFVEQGRLDSADASHVLATFASIHFTERDAPTLVGRLREPSDCSDAVLVAAKDAFGAPSQKTADGLAMLRGLKEELARIARIDHEITQVLERSVVDIVAKPLPPPEGSGGSTESS